VDLIMTMMIAQKITAKVVGIGFFFFIA